jgi:hypothetical protein
MLKANLHMALHDHCILWLGIYMLPYEAAIEKYMKR